MGVVAMVHVLRRGLPGPDIHIGIHNNNTLTQYGGQITGISAFGLTESTESTG